MLAAALIAGLVAAAPETQGWTAAVQSAVRGGAGPSPGGLIAAGQPIAGELEVAAQLGLLTKGLLGSAAISYTPQLLLRRAVTGELIGVGDSTRQGGALDLATRLGRGTHLTSSTTAAWGLTDFSPFASTGLPVEQGGPSGQHPPPAATGDTGGRLPASRFVHTLDLNTGLALAQVFSRELRLSVDAGFHRTGGIGRDAQLLPFQWGPQGGTSVAWSPDRDNTLSLRTSVSQSRFSLGRSSLLADAQVGWLWQALREWRLELGAGAGFVRSRESELLTRDTYLAGGLRVRWDAPARGQRRLGASLGANLVPGIDPITGRAMQAVRAGGTFELANRGLLLLVDATLGRTVSGIGEGTQDAAAGVRGSWTLGSGWAAIAGLGVARTNQAPIAGWTSQVSAGLRWGAAGQL